MNENFMLYGWMLIVGVMVVLTCIGIWLNYYLGEEDDDFDD